MRLLLGSVVSQIGWLVVALTSIFFWAFVAHADLSGWRFKHAASEGVRGQAFECRSTHLAEGGSRNRHGTPIYENRYRYTVFDRTYEASSFATGLCMAGHPVDVEYLVKEPSYSRIVGMRRNLFPPATAVVGVLPAGGVLLILLGWRKGWMHLHLLRAGRAARATVTEKLRTRTQSGNRSVYRVTLIFTSHTDQTGRIVTRLTRPDRLDVQGATLVLYDPADVNRAALLSSMPGRIQSGPGGQPVSTASPAFVILPALTIFGNALYLLLR